MRPLVISLLLATIAIAHPSIKHTHTRRKLHKPASLPYSDHGSDMNSLTPKNSTAPKKSGCHYIVPSTGSFTHKEIFDFETLNTLPEELHADQYDISPANDRAYGYNKQNVVVTPKTLHLRVPGGQEGMIYNAQMCTTVQDILYGSVRTWAKISDVPGVCHGKFCFPYFQHL